MEIKIELESDTKGLELFGPADKHLRIVRTAMDVKISARNGSVVISGADENVQAAGEVIDRMQKRLIERNVLDEGDVKELIEQTIVGGVGR